MFIPEQDFEAQELSAIEREKARQRRFDAQRFFNPQEPEDVTQPVPTTEETPDNPV